MIAHTGPAVVAESAARVGSSMYGVLPEHWLALVAGVLIPVAAWFLVRHPKRFGARVSALTATNRRLPGSHRFAAWMILISASVHLGLVPAHLPSRLAAAFLLDAGALSWVWFRLVTGRSWRLLAGLLLSANVVAFGAAMFQGDAPDQVGIATLLAQLAALGVVLTPEPSRRMRRLAGSAALVSLVVLAGISVWGGAFVSVASGSEPGIHDHSAGAIPGTLLGATTGGEPTPEQRAAADRFYDEAVRALARYRDPAVAAADGFLVEGLAGTDFHAANPAHSADGRVFDPARPESLVYAQTASGPVLLGAVYEMPTLGRTGPAIGGPITQWHAHENVCFSLTPPAFSGLVSPFGGCPAASITFPITPEMIHVWVVPGAPQPFGDLPDGWRESYLASFG